MGGMQRKSFMGTTTSGIHHSLGTHVSLHICYDKHFSFHTLQLLTWGNVYTNDYEWSREAGLWNPFLKKQHSHHHTRKRCGVLCRHSSWDHIIKIFFKAKIKFELFVKMKKKVSIWVHLALFCVFYQLFSMRQWWMQHEAAQIKLTALCVVLFFFLQHSGFVVQPLWVLLVENFRYWLSELEKNLIGIIWTDVAIVI